MTTTQIGSRLHADRLFAYRLSERVYRVPLSALMELLWRARHRDPARVPAEEADRLWDGISGEHRAAPDGA